MSLTQRTRSRDESGMALILVMVLSLILLLVPLGVAVADEGQSSLARLEVDRSAALAAADAGVDDYINRLNNNPNYWQQSVPTTGTQPTPADGNPALEGWVRTSSLGSSAYCYNVDYTYSGGSWAYDTSVTAQQGIVLLTVYGYSGPNRSLPASVSTPNVCAGTVPGRGVEKVIQVGLRQDGFLDYAEMTDLNLVDENLYNASVPQANQVNDCTNTATRKVYNYIGLPGDCAPLINYWGTGTGVTGPIRSNDDFYICGNPVFTGVITSDDTTASVAGHQFWADPAGSCGSDNPVFDGTAYQSGGTITRSSSMLNFPTSDSADIQYAKSGGCYYVGPTDITLSGSQMTVVSPMSSTSTTNAACLGAGPVAVPSNGVVFVDSVAANCSAQINITWADPGQCTTTQGPGDIFISGTGVTSALTVVANNNIFIDGNLTVANSTFSAPQPNNVSPSPNTLTVSSSSQQIIGLVANNDILLTHYATSSGNVYSPQSFAGSTTIPSPAGWGSSACPGTTAGVTPATVNVNTCSLQITAAMLALQHSFAIQDFNLGAPWGAVYVSGSIAEEFMDILGTFGAGCSPAVDDELCSGILNTYGWDSRLAHLSPPHFLSAKNTQWEKLTYEECPPKAGCRS